MKALLIILTTLLLTGCGAYGEPLWLARIADANDPCQIKYQGYRPPSFCGAASGPTLYTRDYRTGRIVYTTRPF